MKRLVSIILFLVAVSLGCFAQQRTATLSHNGKLTVFNSERCLPEAYDAAVDGDTIFLSSGNWPGAEFQTNGNFTITKKISFIGNGRSTFLDGFVFLNLSDREDKFLKSTLFDGIHVGSFGVFYGVFGLDIRNCMIDILSIGHFSCRDSIEFNISKCYIPTISFENYGFMGGNIRNSKIKIDRFPMEKNHNIRFSNCHVNKLGCYTFSGYASSSIFWGKSYEMRPKLLEKCLYQWSEVVHDDEWEEREKSEYIDCYELPYTSEADIIFDENLDYVGPDLIASGYIGTDGTQVGIYGGEQAPYTEYPSLRCVDSGNSEIRFDGNKGISHQLSFYGNNNDPIVGFRSVYNNDVLAYIPVNYIEGEKLSATITIPENKMPLLEGRPVNLDRQTEELWVDVTADDIYGIQPMTESGWGVFTTLPNPVAGRYAATAKEIWCGEPVELNKCNGLHFQAVRFDVPFAVDAMPVKGSQSGRLDLYRKESNGTLNLIASIEPDSLKSGSVVELPEGRYYGILYNMPINEDNPDSNVTLQIGETKPEPPIMYYDGRYLHMHTDSDKYEIRFSIGSGNLGGMFPGGEIDVEGQLGTAIAWAVDYDSKTESEPAVMEIYGYGNESMAVTSVPGVLASCYEWNGGRMDGKRFSVAGPLDASDYAWLNTHVSAYHLDLSEVTGDSIPDGALAPEWVKSIVLPSDVKGMSGKIFKTSGAPFNTNVTLCALKWTSSNPIPVGMLDSLGNSNMLLYVDNESLARNVADHGHTLVVAGVAESLQLNGAHFYCPEEFVAKEASYYRYNNWETGIDGECAGWKTIVVPYDVQRVEHSKGDLTPFGVNTDMELLRYWLYEPTTSGWERATSIRANEPYLIAMPNNEVYYEPFNVGGNVWFKATNAVVAVTPDEISRDFAGGRKLVGVYEGMASAEDRFGINHDTVEVGGVTYRPGSVFISQVDKGISPASPFEAYMLSGGESMIRPMAIFTSSEVEAVLADMEMKVWTENGGIRIQAGFTARVDIFDMTGRRVAVADVKAGEVCCVDGLAPGIYIAANRKVLLK